MSNKAFIISCKESKYIIECVNNIRKFYIDTPIYIVDSCSDDKSYFILKNEYQNLYIEDICNKNYEYGAYIYWFKHYGDLYETYIFMQDSINLTAPINELNLLTENEVLIFDYNNTGWLSDTEARNEFYEIISDYPGNNSDLFPLVIWNTFCIKKNTFIKVLQSEIFKIAIPPNNKSLSRAWERLWSIIFRMNEICIKSINTNQIIKIFGNRK